MSENKNGMLSNSEINNMALIPEYEQSKDKSMPNNINQYQITQNKIIISK